MKIAIHEISTIRASFEEDLRAYHATGWSHVELELGKVGKYVQEYGLSGAKALLRETEMTPVGATGHVVRAFGSLEEIERNEAEFKSRMETLNALECPVIVIGGDGPGQIPQAPNSTEAGLRERDEAYAVLLNQFADQCAKLADIAQSYGVTIAVEVNWCAMVRSLRAAGAVIQRANHPHVGLLFDTAHFTCSQSRLSDLAYVQGKIVYAHLNDMRDAMPEIRNLNNDRVIPGKGVLPLREIIAAVEAAGYGGYHSVEIFSDDLWAMPPKDAANAIRLGCLDIWDSATF